MNKPLLIKRIASVASVVILSLAIVVTAFVFGREEGAVIAADSADTKSKTPPVTTPQESGIVTTTATQKKTDVKATTTKPVATEKATEADNIPLVSEQKLVAEATISNVWHEGEKNRSQIDVSVKNNSDEQIEGWRVTLSFDGNVMVVDGWNGDFSENADEITVTPVQYNSSIVPDAQISFGMILSSDGELSIQSVVVE